MDCPHRFYLEKVEAHDAVANRAGNPTSLGNEREDRPAKQAANHQAVRYAYTVGPRFADAVERLEGHGIGIRNLSSTVEDL